MLFTSTPPIHHYSKHSFLLSTGCWLSCIVWCHMHWDRADVATIPHTFCLLSAPLPECPQNHFCVLSRFPSLSSPTLSDDGPQHTTSELQYFKQMCCIHLMLTFLFDLTHSTIWHKIAIETTLPAISLHHPCMCNCNLTWSKNNHFLGRVFLLLCHMLCLT